MQRSDFSILSGQDIAYLDNAATSLLLDAAQEAMTAYERGYRANVARGIYPWAEQATQAREQVRADIATSLGADPAEIIFTAGASAGLDYVARLAAQLLSPEQQVLLTELEHHSNILPWQINYPERLIYAACEKDGSLPLERIEELLEQKDCGLISVTHASNVTGAVVDVDAIAKLARARGALTVVDGAQYVPHSWPQLDELGVDAYIFSAHKCNGPMGLGVLWLSQELQQRVQPATGGGGSVMKVDEQDSSYVPGPQRHEAGTPNVAGIIGLGKVWQARRQAVESGHWDKMQQRLSDCIAKLSEALAAEAGVELASAAPTGPAVPLVSFNLAGCHAHDVCQLLADRGVYLRGGHHCAQPLMRRLGTTATVRASLGPHVEDQDIQRLISALPAIRKTLGA